MKKEAKALEDMKKKMDIKKQDELRKLMIDAANIMIENGAEVIEGTLKTKTHYLKCTIKIDPQPRDSQAN